MIYYPYFALDFADKDTFPMPFSLCSRSVTGASVLVVFAVTSFGSATAFAQQAVPPAPPAKITPAAPSAAYLRDVKGKDGAVQAVQSAIRRFEPVSGNGPAVYLVAAVHIGETSYYQGLQQFLNKQDVVLYERVKLPRAAATQTAAAPAASFDSVSKPANPGSPVSVAKPGKPVPPPVGLQKQLSDVLGLQFQLDGIDYGRPNFRNSDLAWDDMESLAKKSGVETQQALTTLKTTLSGGPTSGPVGAALNNLLAQARANPAFATMLRRVMVELFADPAKIAAIQNRQSPEQAKLQTIIITERNKAVLSDLKSLLQSAPESGQKPVRTIAVLYGAEHMRDMAQHLVTDLGYRPAETEWLTAIKTTPNKATP